MYFLNHRPSVKELNDIVNHHNAHYVDYCKVWFADGTKRNYFNTEPRIDYWAEDKIDVDFFNPTLRCQEGQFGKMNIIRAKRIILPIDKDGNLRYNKTKR